MDGYQMLANAILYRACKDYKVKYKRLMKYKKNTTEYKRLEVELQGIEKFLHSEYAELLSNVNVDYVIERIKNEIRK